MCWLENGNRDRNTSDTDDLVSFDDHRALFYHKLLVFVTMLLVLFLHLFFGLVPESVLHLSHRGLTLSIRLVLFTLHCFASFLFSVSNFSLSLSRSSTVLKINAYVFIRMNIKSCWLFNTSLAYKIISFGVFDCYNTSVNHFHETCKFSYYPVHCSTVVVVNMCKHRACVWVWAKIDATERLNFYVGVFFSIFAGVSHSACWDAWWQLFSLSPLAISGEQTVFGRSFPFHFFFFLFLLTQSFFCALVETNCLFMFR